MKYFACCTLIFSGYLIKAQLQPQSIKCVTTNIGSSAISVSTITAKTFQLMYPIANYHADSAGKQLIYTAKQNDATISQYVARGYVASIGAVDDKVKWINETSLDKMIVAGNSVLVSNDLRSVRYNKSLGYEETRFDQRIVKVWPGKQRGFNYDKQSNKLMNCVDLFTGSKKWSAVISGAEDWNDSRLMSDSVLLIAAAGLHAVHLTKGALWTYSLSTSVRTNKPLVYSPARYQTLLQFGSQLHTASEERLVTQLSSNIAFDKDHIYFAGREKLIAVNRNGKQAWQVDLRAFPVSRMMLYTTDSSVVLANFGLASHSGNMVAWGKPFILTINSTDGRILNTHSLADIENLADFVVRKGAFIFAGKKEILEAVPGKRDLNTVIDIEKLKIGKFSEFIDGDTHYVFTEGHYVPLNFINDNLVYFKTDNNKVYGIEGDHLLYEYHFTELFRFDKKVGENTLLMNDEKTILTSRNFELLATFELTDPSVLINNRIYFVHGSSVHMVKLDEIK